MREHNVTILRAFALMDLDPDIADRHGDGSPLTDIPAMEEAPLR